MTEHRPHGAAAEPPPRLTERLRTLVATEAPLRRPKPSRLDPVRRSWIAGYWQARIAVRAAMPLDDFLRARLARYVAALPVPSALLPLQVAVEDGAIQVRQAAAPPRPPPPEPGAEGWMAPLVAVDGPAAREEATQLEVRLALLDGEIEAARRRAEEVGHRLAMDVSSGLVAAPAQVEATAEQLGRPPVRSAGPRNAALALVAGAVAAETWQVALPLLAGASIDPTRVAAELSARPGEVVPIALFALGVSAALFALAHAGLDAATTLASGEGEPRRRRWLAAAAAGAAALGLLVAGAVAALAPAGTPAAARGPALALLLVAVPVAATLALRFARRAEDARAGELAVALAWDRERARELAERGRRLEEVSWAEGELRSLERQRDAVRRRLRELNLRAIEAAEITRDFAEGERAALARLAQGLVAALELDRYEFVRQATERGAQDLFAPRRRKAPEVRPSLDAPPAAAPGELEPGRLAS